MNRTILIVICDFLLVSLLAFSTVDINKVADEGSARNVSVTIATNQPDSGKDLAAVMRVALDEERKSRDLLMSELTKERETANQRQAQLSEREQQLQAIQQMFQARDQEARRLQQDLQAKEQAAAKLQQDLQTKEQAATQLEQNLRTKEAEAARLAQAQATLQQQYAAAQTNLLSLSQQLRTSSTDAMISKERLAAMEAEVRRQAEQAAALQQNLNFLQQSNQLAVAEKQQLAGKLQVAEVERRHATEQVGKMQEQLKVERDEKAKLAEGVKVLASKSTELEQEIRQNRPLAPNTIFNEFVANRVQARFAAARTGIFGGDSVRRKDTDTILVTDGTNTFALCHVDQTPLTLWNPGTDWEGLSGTLLGRNTTSVPVRSMSFHLRDPRIVFVPLTPADVKTLGSRTYKLATDPFKFQDAVLIGTRESYYGECRFAIDVSSPDYVQLDRSVIRGMFGKFNPSKGDLVLSKNGELLGIMANNTYCLKIENLFAGATFQFGQDVRNQNTGQILSLLYTQVIALPSKLQ